MKRTRNKSRGEKPEQRLPMYTPERVAAAVRVTGAQWNELGRRLRSLQGAFDACGAGGEAPVLMCRARVKLMLGAWRALTPDARALLANPSGDEEHFRWMDEYSQVMKPWLTTFEGDLKEYGTTKENEDPDEGLSFVPEAEVALGHVIEVYDDWSLVAWPLSTIDAPGGYAESEIKRFDVQLQRIEQRMKARSAMRFGPRVVD